MSDALCRLVYENVRGRDQHKEVHFTEATEVQVLGPRVGDGADLREEAASHTQLGRIDLEYLTQELRYGETKEEENKIIPSI